MDVFGKHLQLKSNITCFPSDDAVVCVYLTDQNMFTGNL